MRQTLDCTISLPNSSWKYLKVEFTCSAANSLGGDFFLKQGSSLPLILPPLFICLQLRQQQEPWTRGKPTYARHGRATSP